MMQGVMTEMGEWPAYHWGGNADLTAQCKNTVRLATSLLRRKLEWADTVPYILCRVHQPGVALQALAQYDRLSDHHPVTEYYLKPGSPFRAQIEQIPVEGVPEAALSVDLRRQWAPIFSGMSGVFDFLFALEYVHGNTNGISYVSRCVPCVARAPEKWQIRKTRFRRQLGIDCATAPRLVSQLTFLPLSDYVCEFPHSAANREYSRCRNASFPWVSSTLRLK